MRKREQDLIIGLAEGTLEDETEARALIDSSPQHRLEYETQMAARAALRSVEPARLSDHERAALHRDVWTRLQQSPATPARSPWLYRWAYVAGGLLVVAVGLGTIFGRDSDSASPALDNLAVTETHAATGTTESAADAAMAETDMAEEASVPGNAETPFAPLFSLFEERANLLRAGEAQAYAGGETADDGAATDHEDCIAQADLEGYEALGEISAEEARGLGVATESSYIIAVPAGAEVGEGTPVVFIETGTCVVVHTAG